MQTQFLYSKKLHSLKLAMNFLLNLINSVREMLNISQNSPPPMSTVELESNSPTRNAANTTVNDGRSNSMVHRETTANDQMIWPWALLVCGACFAAVSAALQALQTKGPLPAISHLVIVALVVSFTAAIVSVYIRPDNKLASLVAAHVGTFFGATAFVVALVANLQTPYMAISIALYSTGILAIIFVKIFKWVRAS